MQSCCYCARVVLWGERVMTRIRPMLPAVLVLCLASCGKPPPPPPAPPTVLVSRPLVQPVTDWEDYSGRFEAMDWVEVRPRVSAAIESVHFADGEAVRKGQLLFVLDARPWQALLARARAELATAEAALALADAELQRARTLVAGQLISRSQLDLRSAAQQQASAAVAAAQASVQTQELNLSYARVTAPLSGRASWRRLAPGNLVTADTTVLTTIASIDPIRFVFDLPESALLRHQRSGADVRQREVDIRLQDETEYRWKGRVDFLDNALDRSAGTLRARARIANPEGRLTPGMFGQLRLLAPKAQPALLIPDQALVTDQTRQVVYVVDDQGAVTQHVVQPGRLVGGLRVIRSGIDAQDQVVISGMQRARPGKPVTVQQGQISSFPSGVSLGDESRLTPAPGGLR